MIHLRRVRGAESPGAPVRPHSPRAPWPPPPTPSGQGRGTQLPCWPHPAPPAPVTWGQALSPGCLRAGSAQVCHHHVIIVATAAMSVTVIRGRIRVWISN